MNILEKIIEHKRTEIAISKRHIAVEELKQRKFGSFIFNYFFQYIHQLLPVSFCNSR